MQVLVTKTKPGSPDGIAVHSYKEGSVYGPATVPPMPADLAIVFVREHWGEVVEEVHPKALPGAPENKMLGGAEENKAGEAASAPTTAEATADDPSNAATEAQGDDDEASTSDEAAADRLAAAAFG